MKLSNISTKLKERKNWLENGGNFKTELENTYTLDGHKTTFYRISIIHNNKTIGGTNLMISNDPSFPKKVGQTSNLEIQPNYRGKGLGHILYQEVVHTAIQMGLREIQSDTNTREATRKIWLKLGAIKKDTPEGPRYCLDLTNYH